MDFLDFKNNLEHKMLQEKLYKSIAAEAGKKYKRAKSKSIFLTLILINLRFLAPLES